MSAVMSPIMVGVPSLKTGGVVNSGGFIYTYLAGTTTPADTYTDNTLNPSSKNSNPIVLNSLGLAPQEIWWNSGTYFKFIITDALGNAIGTYDNLVGVNDTGSTTASEWITLSLTPTYISATSFSVSGNQTSILQPYRRLKTTNTGGTIYSSISTSSFGAGITTVVVVNDSGVLDSGLSRVEYGLLSFTNPSFPIYSSFPLSKNTFSASASSIFTMDTARYNGFLIRFLNVLPATNTVDLRVYIGTGGVFDVNTYNWVRAVTSTASATVDPVSGVADPYITAGASVGNDAASPINGFFYYSELSGSHRVQWDITYITAAGAFVRISGGGEDTNASARDQIRFLFSSGNIASGSMSLYGFML